MINEQEPLVRGANPDPASPNHAPLKTADQARSGVELGRMRWVPRISLALVVLALLAAWLFGR